jgi:hypothetical protein
MKCWDVSIENCSAAAIAAGRPQAARPRRLGGPLTCWVTGASLVLPDRVVEGATLVVKPGGSLPFRSVR